MTETRELPRGEWRAIGLAAHELFMLLNKAMDRVPSGDEWSDLHNLMQLASVISSQSVRAARIAPDPDAPVPYTVPDHAGCRAYADWLAEHASTSAYSNRIPKRVWDGS